MSPGRAESHGFEYKRNGTLSLFAALNSATGEVLGRTAPRHTNEQFVGFLEDVVTSQPRRREIHVVRDSVSNHETDLAFLAAHSSLALESPLVPQEPRTVHRVYPRQGQRNVDLWLTG